MKDEDFVGGDDDDDGGSPTDDSGEDDSDASEGSDEEKEVKTVSHSSPKLFHQQIRMFKVSDLIPVIDSFQKSVKKEPKKEASSSKGLPPKRKPVATEEGSSKKKKQKKKKDPNAPKRAMSGFIFFSQMERDVSSSLLFNSRI